MGSARALACRSRRLAGNTASQAAWPLYWVHFGEGAQMSTRWHALPSLNHQLTTGCR